MLNTHHLQITERCESSHENYQTEPRSSRVGSGFKSTSKVNQSNSFALGAVQLPHSSSPLRGLGSGYNLNQLRQKNNHELIRQSLHNFEKSFRDILHSKSPNKDDEGSNIRKITLQAFDCDDIKNEKIDLTNAITTKNFTSKRMSAAECLDYKTLRNEKKLGKKQIFNYRSQQSSLDREEKDDCFYKCSLSKDKKLNKDQHSSQKSLNQMQVYKVKIPLKEKKNVGSGVNTKILNKTSSNATSLLQINSNKKNWK